MREVLSHVSSWLASDQRFALATVVAVHGSAPRQPGAAMAVSVDGEVVGSVSGGCVEGAVYELATEVLGSGTPALRSYGISDEDAFAVGLTCGGTLEVFVCPVDAPGLLADVVATVEQGRPVALATVVAGSPRLGSQLAVWPDRVAGTLGTDGLDRAVADEAVGMLAQGQAGVRHYGPDGERRQDEVAVFVQSFVAPPRMLVFGAIDFASAVVSIGKFLGYHVTVCDARPVFATATRFPEADEVVCRWPHDFLATVDVDERTVVAVLTHDPKFDVPLLERALRTPAAYVGAMGSRRTHEDRLQRLRETGLDEGLLGRLRSPIGLDLGGRTPQEVAVSIAAEVIALRWRGSGRPLTETDGDVHPPADVEAVASR